jgi:hypothetical protein
MSALSDRPRAEHLQWCKDRALEYVARGDLRNAMASMLSDLQKHPGTALPATATPTLAILAAVYVRDHDVDGMRRWVEGFN